jgi:hypothetical protein
MDYFKILHEGNRWNVYLSDALADGPANPIEQFATREEAERNVAEQSFALGALEEIYDEATRWVYRLAKKYHIGYEKAVAFINMAVMRLDDETWGDESHHNLRALK